MLNQKSYVAFVAILFLSTAHLHAELISAEAFDNATVQSGGPRSGSGGKAFFNIEGEDNGNFASYGVADFNFPLVQDPNDPTPPPPIAYIQSMTLRLTQANSAFSQSGSVVMALDASPIPAGIQPGTSPLAYSPPGYGTFQDELQGELTMDYLFGLFPIDVFQQFYPISTGFTDTYSFLFAPWQQTALTNRLNSGSTIRMVIAPADPFVEATWAGFSHSSLDGPTLELDVVYVPEPTSHLLLVCGCAVGIAAKRQWRANC